MQKSAAGLLNQTANIKILKEDLMSISLTPLGNRVVIEAIEEEEITAGGIVLPETAKEKPQKGKVLSVGPGDRSDTGDLIPMQVEVGNTVRRQSVAR